MSTSIELTLRFSHIRGLVEEIDLFPYDEEQGYGFIIPSTGGVVERIMGICPSPDDDLMIFRERSVTMYEVASGRIFGSRLRNLFRGIGLATHKAIAYDTDYGVFWYDYNDVYMYPGGIAQPTRISQNRIQKYWRNNLAEYIPFSFAIFNRNKLEYWIFIQTSGTLNDFNEGEFNIFKYSLEHDNWNIMRFPFVPISATQRVDGMIEVVASTAESNIMFQERNGAIKLPVGHLESHEIDFGDSQLRKQFEEIYSDYTTDGSFTLTLLINNETTAATGNTKTFVTGRTIDKRPVKAFSSSGRIRVRYDQLDQDYTDRINEIGLNFRIKRERYGAKRA
jgi:hypothetical protein